MPGPKSIGGEPPRVSRRYFINTLAKGVVGAGVLSGCGRTGLEVGPYDRLPCNGVERIRIDGSPQKIAAAAMKWMDGDRILETGFKIPYEGAIFIDPLRGPGSTLELSLGINNSRLVTDEAGRITDSEGMIRIQTEPGAACEAALSSCAPFRGLGPKIVPVGLVRKTFDGKTLLLNRDEFVAAGRMRDAYFGSPVFKFRDVGGIERLAVRVALTDPTLSCVQTFYFEVNRDGKLLSRDNNVVENPEGLLPILRFDETTGSCVVTTVEPGGLSDLNLLVTEVGEEALRITYFYYRYDPVTEEYKDKDEVGDPIPIPASERPWEKEYEVLADPNRGLSDIGDLAGLQALVADPGEVELIIEDLSVGGMDPQRAVISLLDMEQENPGSGLIIDPGFYRSDDLAVQVTLRMKSESELQPELIYAAGLEGRLSLRCE